MSKSKKQQLLVDNLPQLQNLIKRDALSYKSEFIQQWRHFQSRLGIMELDPSKENHDLADVVTFVSHVATCYPTETKEFPQQIIDTLTKHYMTMDAELRRSMVSALILLRNRDVVQSTDLLSLFFTLFRCKDKQLRQTLHTHIVNDIKNSNAKHKNNKLNKTLQNFMYTMLKDPHEIAVKKSLDVMIDLYRKNVWNDAKTVNVIAEACFSTSPKIVATALNFFLGSNTEKDESDDEKSVDVMGLRHARQVAKKTKGRAAAMDRAMSKIKRKERASSRAESFNFSALHLLDDPQGFAEKLFVRLRTSSQNNELRFEVRLLMMSLISRLIGIHKLTLLNFYPFLIKYLQPHQRDVTHVLAYAAQASHDMVPPDAIEPVVQAIANNFIWSNAANQVVVAGMNGLREVVARCPLAMPDELLGSLIADFKAHREKGVTMAARALLGLFRDINPHVLAKKDRGKAATMSIRTEGAQPLRYGHREVASGIAGAELLDQSSESEPGELAGEGEFEGEQGWEGWEEVGSGEASEESGEESEGEESDEEVGEEEEWATDNEEIISGEEIILENDEEPESSESEPVHAPKPAAKPTKQAAMPVEATRIFDDADFKRLKKLRAQQLAMQSLGQIGKKRTADEAALDSTDESESEPEFGDIVDPSRLLHGSKEKADKAARLESIRSGRDERKFGSTRGKKQAGQSLTNKEKEKKNKAFMMTVHKREVYNKRKRTTREKAQIARRHGRRQKDPFRK